MSIGNFFILVCLQIQARAGNKNVHTEKTGKQTQTTKTKPKQQQQKPKLWKRMKWAKLKVSTVCNSTENSDNNFQRGNSWKGKKSNN